MTNSTPTPPPNPTDLSRRKRLSLLPQEERERLIAEYARQAGLSIERMVAKIRTDWRFNGRPKQLAPVGDWMFWFIRAGRGFGKTLSAAEWIKEQVEQPFPDRPDEEGVTWRVALVAPTLGDVRVTMVEGETGLLSILPASLLRGGTRDSAWNRGTCELYLANGTYMKGFSSDVPGRLRGPQHHFLWGEEVSSWLDAHLGDSMGSGKDVTFTNAKLGLRLGARPRAVLTSTPKANRLTRDIVNLPALATSVGSSLENRDNLSELWWQTVIAPIIGTRTGRQEVNAEILDDVEGALWRLAQIDARRIDPADVPPLNRIVVAVDPNASSDEAANDAGVIVVGRNNDFGRRAYVLADRTITKGGPRAWAAAAVDAYYEFEADRIVAEKNNGGEMVKITIKTVDKTVPVKLVSASKGKRTRAEPVSALYEEGELHPLGQVFHAGVFPELEDQMVTWTPDAESPDRLDAAVWGLSELMLGPTMTSRSNVPKGRLPVAGA